MGSKKLEFFTYCSILLWILYL